MSITIKDVYGKTLYVAKHAHDVRAAAQEAVRAKANLGHANLRHADLRHADLGHADLGSANLRHADLGSANLRHADLRYADLGHANLRYADLGSANLGYADLGSANLGYANLGSAKGVDARHHNPLLLLLDQPGKVRAYKLVTSEYMSPIQMSGRMTYTVGAVLECPNANPDPLVECGAGINVATLPWCVANWRHGHRIMLVEFTAKDVAAVPLSDGKFRLRRCKVLRELDLVTEVGLGLPVEGVAA